MKRILRELICETDGIFSSRDDEEVLVIRSIRNVCDGN
jgi:hypothetical protein